MYLDVANSANLPNGWSRFAKFSLAVVNQNDDKYTVRKAAQHQFSLQDRAWGFTSFMPLSELYDPSRGYIVNDSCTIEAEVTLCRVMDNLTSDSEEAAYQIPTTKNDTPSESIPLQRNTLLVKSKEAEPGSSVPVKVLGTVAKMDPVKLSMPKPEMQTKLDGKRNELVGVVKAFAEVQLEEQVPKPASLVKCATPSPVDVKAPVPKAQSGEIAISPKFPGAGQLFEEGRHRHQGVFFYDDKYEDVGGFSVLKTQESLYKQIWLKYGHIASSQVLSTSYSGQVMVVTDIMTSVIVLLMCLTK